MFPPLTTLVENLESPKEDRAELRTKLDHIQSEMGLFSRKMDELIRIAGVVYHGVKQQSVSSEPSDFDIGTQVTDHMIIHWTSSAPHYA